MQSCSSEAGGLEETKEEMDGVEDDKVIRRERR